MKKLNSTVYGSFESNLLGYNIFPVIPAGNNFEMAMEFVGGKKFKNTIFFLRFYLIEF